MVSYSEREWWVDYAKTIGIFLVVFIHALTVNYGNVELSIDRNILILGVVFHMPLFFFISGYLYKQIKPKVALKKYFKRLIIPYVFFYILGSIVYIQYKKLYVNPELLFSTIGKLTVGMFLSDETILAGNGPIWFLLALFVVIILFSLIKNYIKDDKKVLLIILGFNLLLYALHEFNINLYFSLDNALLGISFFYTGYLAKKHDIMDYFRNNYINITMFIFLLVLTYLEFVYNGYLGIRSASWKGNMILSYLGAFAGIFMIISISSVLSKYKNKMIFLISINTLTIMALDQILRHFLALTFKSFGIKNTYPLLNVFIMTILVIILSIIIAELLNKYAPVLIGNQENLKFKFYLKNLKNHFYKKAK